MYNSRGWLDGVSIPRRTGVNTIIDCANCIVGVYTKYVQVMENYQDPAKKALIDALYEAALAVKTEVQDPTP